jgi:Ala-tRNA(Pro) deacylase
VKGRVDNQSQEPQEPGSIAARYPRVVTAMSRFLEMRDVPHEVVEGPADAETPRDRADAGDGDCTAVALRVRGGWRMALIPASRRIDLAKARLALGDASARLATQSEIEAIFPDFEPGVLPPIGPHYPDPELIDRRLLAYERLGLPTGWPEQRLVLDPRAIVDWARPVVADISRD